jgi:glyoxylase-like metal-dependent hydrolase (beta-lactamase superfamily II)
MSVNAYLAWDEVTREAALFDTGFDSAPVVRLIEENGLDLRYIFITHAHSDHVAGIPALQTRFPKVRLRRGSRSAPAEQRNKPQECVQLGSLRITHRETPGHADDAVTYIVGNWSEDAPHVAFVGDALFAGSMGRALPQPGIARDLIRDRILSLPAETLLCPGHGPLTTVAQEKEHNPFF